MRYLPAILRKLFKTVPPMPEVDDPIGHQLDEAVAAHEHQAVRNGVAIDNLQGAIDDVLALLEPTR